MFDPPFYVYILYSRVYSRSLVESRAEVRQEPAFGGGSEQLAATGPPAARERRSCRRSRRATHSRMTGE